MRSPAGRGVGPPALAVKLEQEVEVAVEHRIVGSRGTPTASNAENAGLLAELRRAPPELFRWCRRTTRLDSPNRVCASELTEAQTPATCSAIRKADQ
jgi:hypothetical protein